MPKKPNANIHFRCSNCKRVYRIKAINGYLCSGIVKLPYRADYYRICMVRKIGEKSEIKFDVRYDECKDICFLTGNLLLKRGLRKKHED